MNKYNAIISDSRLYNCQDKRYHHVAFILKGRKKVVSATNNYNRSYINRKCMPSVHAEINVARRIKGSVKGLDILVIRINRESTTLCDSLPCTACGEFLLDKGFKNVYYSNDQGIITKMKLNQLRKYYSNSWIKSKCYCRN